MAAAFRSGFMKWYFHEIPAFSVNADSIEYQLIVPTTMKLKFRSLYLPYESPV